MAFPQNIFVILALIATFLLTIILAKIPFRRIIFRAIFLAIIFYAADNTMAQPENSQIEPRPIMNQDGEEYGPTLPPTQNANQQPVQAQQPEPELAEWWKAKSLSGNPDPIQAPEWGPAAKYSTRTEYMQACREQARKLPVLQRTVQRLQIAALQSQNSAPKVNPETMKLEQRNAHKIEEKGNEMDSSDPLNLDFAGLTDVQAREIRAMLKLGAELTKNALRLLEFHKKNAQLGQTAAAAIKKARNEMEGPLEFAQQNGKQKVNQKSHSACRQIPQRRTPYAAPKLSQQTLVNTHPANLLRRHRWIETKEWAGFRPIRDEQIVEMPKEE